MSEEEDPILSSELQEKLEYGTNTDILVLPANTTQQQLAKKAKKRQRDALPTEDVKEEVRKISKKKQKRLDQLVKRKEREAKRSDYLATIKEHEMSAADQLLLTSSKALNHTLSLKETVSLLLKKEKAGIKLTEEELNVLYVKRNEPSKDLEDYPEDLFALREREIEVSEALPIAAELQSVEKHSNKKSKKSKRTIEDEDIASVVSPIEKQNTIATAVTDIPSAPAAVVSLDDLFAAPPAVAAAPTAADGKKAKKSKKKKPQVDVEMDCQALQGAAGDPSSAEREQRENTESDIAAPAFVVEEQPAVSKKKKDKNADQAALKNIGSNLLSQLMQLKGGKIEKKAAVDEEQEEKEKEDEKPMAVEEEQAEPAQQTAAYKFDEIAMPVSELGVVQRSADYCESAIDPAARKVVAVRRPAKVVAERINLPVCRMEQEIVEAINSNDVVILCGETGSGKSTQVPQFLYEAGYAEDGLIGIAQPRRVAVTSTADRVNYEMGEEEEDNDKGKRNKKKSAERNGRLVGYQIRYDASTVGRRTKIKFLTDGILLREVTSDILLRSYRVVILDEAHERNVNTDILLGMLSRAIPLRKRIAEQEMKKWLSLSPKQREGYAAPLQPLKLVIMSATIRVQDFQTPVLFATPPPLIHVEARQFPVVPHFAKRTELQHYLKETHKKVCQIHRRLPQGGILVFLTGKREILYMCSKLQQSLRVRKNADGKTTAGEREGDEVFAVDGEGEGDERDGEEEVLEEGDEFKKYSSLGDRDQAEIDSDADLDDDEDGGSIGDEDEEEDEDVAFTANQTKDAEQKPSRESEKEGEGQSVADRMLSEILGLGSTPSPSAVAPVEEGEKNEKEKESEERSVSFAVADDAQDPLLLPRPAPGEGEEDSLPALKPLIRPLYAMMPAHLQARVFAPVPPGYRLIVVATNVAETSITIPGVTYVVDSGRCKEKVMSAGTANGSAGIAKYEINWISKASADQRQGRAGRTGPGHCYRLYSANFYHEHMRPFLPPEISSTPLEDVVLQMKALGIREIESFPFPTLPPASALQSALKLLTNLGAVVEDDEDTKTKNKALSSALAKLDEKIKEHAQGVVAQNNDASALSEVGALMAKFPLHPRFAKMLIVAARYTSLPRERVPAFMGYVLTLVATMAERSVFMLDEAASAKNDEEQRVHTEGESDEDNEEDEDEQGESVDAAKRKQRQMQLFYHPNGDAMARLRATGAFVFSVLKECERARAEKAAARARERAKNAEEDNEDDEEQEEKQHKEEQEAHTHGFSRKELQACSAIEEIQNLCDSNFLHLPSLQRVLDLRMQLQSISESLFPILQRESDHSPSLFSGSEQDLAGRLNPPLAPPSAAEEIALRQVLLSGYCDSIARKAPIGVVKEGSRRARLTAYLSCNPAVSEPLYLHPQSNLYHSDPTAALPEFVVYGSILRNAKGDTLYMTNVSVVSATWISFVARDCPLLSWGVPLASPAPAYDPTADQVLCHVVPKFGDRQWDLPAVRRPLDECVKQKKKQDSAASNKLLGHRPEDEAFRWFARFLLEGAVVPQLRGTLTKEKLSEPSSSLTQNKVHPKISTLLRALVKNNVLSRASLLEKVKSSPTFLSEEIQDLLKVEYRKNFRVAWAQMLR